jgi:2-polyprenyl-3-methyl-5-hydroxy-6-metoxy-1,4-benzoquinol methylase
MTEGRFEFGENWRSFLAHVDPRRIEVAEQSMASLLGSDRLDTRRFLDVGCGSGLFSLAARRLGASVVSFDVDEASVACAGELRRRFFPDDGAWTVLSGSALDGEFLASLGRFDVVYAWGVLHHTGRLWEAVDNVAAVVAPGGTFVLAIYNDQGFRSRMWRSIKRLYNGLPRPLRVPYAAAVMLPREALSFAARTALLAPGDYVRSWTEYRKNRGMSRWHDLIDWVGGYPFEVARPEQVFDRLSERGFELRRLKTCGGGLGCNEFVFRRKRTET